VFAATVAGVSSGSRTIPFRMARFGWCTSVAERLSPRQGRMLSASMSGRSLMAMHGRRATSHRLKSAYAVDILAGMAIARLPLIAIDCPDPGALARFYGAMLDWKIDVSADRASVCPEDGQCIAFHRVNDYMPPTWPTQERPKQMHLDMLVDDLDAAEEAVIDLGATKHPDQPGTSYRVFLDPAGHPFCLCLE
jgi:hypothetical protein